MDEQVEMLMMELCLFLTHSWMLLFLSVPHKDLLPGANCKGQGEEVSPSPSRDCRHLGVLPATGASQALCSFCTSLTLCQDPQFHV